MYCNNYFICFCFSPACGWIHIAVIYALRSRHAVFDQRVIDYGLDIIVCLCDGYVRNQALLGDLGACEGVCMHVVIKF